MRFANDAVEIFLQPGEIYFGGSDIRIRTILGSCVAITVWHPRHRIGGMCHYMLATRGARRESSGAEAALNGKYADEALQLLLREIAAAKGRPQEYEVKLFGGGNMFAHEQEPVRRRINVADDNVIAGRALLARHGLAVAAEQLGGRGHRQVIFEISSGDVWVRKHRIDAGAAVIKAEAS